MTFIFVEVYDKGKENSLIMLKKDSSVMVFFIADIQVD